MTPVAIKRETAYDRGVQPVHPSWDQRAKKGPVNI